VKPFIRRSNLEQKEIDMLRIVARCMLLGVVTVSMLGLTRPTGLELSSGASVSAYPVSSTVFGASKPAFGTNGDEMKQGQFAPEAESMALFGVALFAIGTVLRRRLRKS
jgi:hypothetical protein